MAACVYVSLLASSYYLMTLMHCRRATYFLAFVFLDFKPATESSTEWIFCSVRGVYETGGIVFLKSMGFIFAHPFNSISTVKKVNIFLLMVLYPYLF